ncbi:unnamed protein product [Kuraishia capsulata CBS 1993]|uniref:DNA polymerase n=1 Tax=Kuraishia capsulata CBS 1993 TaxID=1382522 RepID=W6MI04_9ASCO|nr:uncharacterized protein KUCA_T00001676001 [Kuraishia capsulata CBS 1993]CDK25706.1 unnamed protein product [Kuraishia capsulata CBS 1993]
MASFISSGSLEQNPAHFVAQITALDSYQSPPFAYLDKPYSTVNGEPTDEKLTQVPIIRVYGKLRTGHTCLIHIHNVFPYLYIQYTGPKAADQITRWLIQLKDEINLRMFLSFQRGKIQRPKKQRKKDGGDRGDGESDSDQDVDDASEQDEDDEEPLIKMRAFISDISLVRGVPFYGYNVGWDGFVKISLVSPRYIRRLTNVLQDGKVFGRPIQPFETHVPLNLQFLKDYNLYCSNWLVLDSWFFRAPIVGLKGDDTAIFNRIKFTDSLRTTILSKMVTVSGTDCYNVLDDMIFPRMGSSMVEVDTTAISIVNLAQTSERQTHSNFIEYKAFLHGSQAENMTYITSTKEMIKDAMYQRSVKNLKDADKAKMFTGSQRNFDRVTWVERDTLNDLFKYCCEMSKSEWSKKFDKEPETSDMLPPRPYLNEFPTAFQSIAKLAYHMEINKFILLPRSSLDASQLLESYAQSHSTQPVPIEVHVPQKRKDTVPDQTSQSQSPVSNVSDADLSPATKKLKTDSEGEPTEPATTSPKKQLSFHITPEDAAEEFIVEEIDRDWTMLRQTQASPVLLKTSNSFMRKANGTPAAKVVRSLFKEEHAFFPKEEIVAEYVGLPPANLDNSGFLKSLETEQGLLQIEYTDPFYSNEDHVPQRPFLSSGKKFVLKSDSIDNLKPYHSIAVPESSVNARQMICSLEKKLQPPKVAIFKYVDGVLPSYENVQTWCKENSISKTQFFKSQIEFATASNEYGFKYKSLERQTPQLQKSFNDMTVLMVETHVNTRDRLNPDPEHDPIGAVFWRFDPSSIPYDLSIINHGCFVLRSESDCLTEMDEASFPGLLSTSVQICETETELIDELVCLISLVDPDVLCGYEIHASSWGYIIERMDHAYGYDFLAKISRVNEKHLNKSKERWGYVSGSAFKVTGRHILNLWRALRHSVNLLKYTLQNVCFHVLHERCPHFDHRQLTSWFKKGSIQDCSFVINYYTRLLSLTAGVLDNQELVNKATEESRLIGIDFYSIFTRGSQYKVEGLLVRIAKEENFMLISPSKKQVFKQAPIQCIALVMEPESAFYKSPLLVLDFQSLYPSMIIAYNICYSTMLGQLRGYDGKSAQQLGVGKVKLPLGFLDLMKDQITITPNGVMFLKPSVRKSLLAKMLTEILDTRLLIKDTLSKSKGDLHLESLYNNRQLALKLIANVTYGYTSASFSGRMPCAEIADSIVSAGRETLNRAIREIEKNSAWGAKIVYGDTDSLFVYLPGKSKVEAFTIGRQMADHITSINPAPVKLKFEKVYHPCVLLSKKRYVGYSYEHLEQKEPKFDAKGIETVRRDGIPAQQKIVECSLRKLFESKDISNVQDYVETQFWKIMNGNFSIQDFCFGKEVRIGTYKNEIHAPPGAIISKRLMEQDHRSEPQYKERVPYLVVKGRKSATLRERCLTPEEFIDRQGPDALELDWNYYITKMLIPPLERIFGLMGVNVRQWFQDMPKMLKVTSKDPATTGRTTILSFAKTLNCLICGRQIAAADPGVCDSCLSDKSESIVRFHSTLREHEAKVLDILTVCRVCCSISHNTKLGLINIGAGLKCDSQDCSMYYTRIKSLRELDRVRAAKAHLLSQIDW